MTLAADLRPGYKDRRSAAGIGRGGSGMATKKRTVAKGLARGLTNYGDNEFSLYMRRSFARSIAYSRAMLARPIASLATSASCFNNCHRPFPHLVVAAKRALIAAGRLPARFPTVGQCGERSGE